MDFNIIGLICKRKLIIINECHLFTEAQMAGHFIRSGVLVAKIFVTKSNY